MNLGDTDSGENLKLVLGKTKEARPYKGTHHKFITKEIFPIGCLTWGDTLLKNDWSLLGGEALK